MNEFKVGQFWKPKTDNMKMLVVILEIFSKDELKIVKYHHHYDEHTERPEIVPAEYLTRNFESVLITYGY